MSSPATGASSPRLPALVALAGVAGFIIAMLSLHGLQPELSPWNDPMSYYVHGRQGWLLTAGLVALGGGSLALTCGVWRNVRGPGARGGRWGLLVWSLGALLGGLFAADPPGQWDRPPSVSGMIHGVAAVVALVTLPVAAVLLCKSLRSDGSWRGIAKPTTWLAWASVAALGLFAASLVPVFVRPGPPVLLGLTERLLMGVQSAWLIVVAIGLLRRVASRPA